MANGHRWGTLCTGTQVGSAGTGWGRCAQAHRLDPLEQVGDAVNLSIYKRQYRE